MVRRNHQWFVLVLCCLSWCSLCLCRASASEPIDRFVSAAWVRDKVTPATLSDDSEFVRRIYLDLVGRIPTKDEVQHFLADRDSQKRSKLIDQLLAGGEFAKHWRENLNSHFMGSPAFTGDGEWR